LKKIEIKSLMDNKRIRDEILRFNNSYFDWRRNRIPFREIIRVREDLLVSSLIESRISGVFSLNYSWINNNVDEDVLQFCKEIVQRQDINKLVRGAFDAVLYGFTPAFVSWRYIDSKIFPVELDFASPEDWECRKGRIVYNNFQTKIVLDDTNKYNIIPIIRNRSDIFPMGEGVIEKLFWHTQYKIGGLEYWTKFSEKYGSPYLVGEADETLEDGTKNVLEQLLARIKSLGWAILPKGIKLTVLEAMGKGASSDIYRDLLQYCREDITLAVLGHTGAAVSTAGKLGGETGAMEVRSDIALSDARIVQEFINTLLSFAVEINFGRAKAAKFEFYARKTGRDIAQRDRLLYGCGVRLTPQYFSDTYGINIDYIDAEKMSAPPFSTQSVAPKSEAYDFAENDADAGGVDSVIDNIRGIIDDCDNYDEAKTRIISDFGSIDETPIAGEIERMLEYAFLLGAQNGN
jgi:phage gp29-like protein